MLHSRPLSLLCAALLARYANAVIGPAGDLVITSGSVTPDGFTRDAILAGGSVVGTLVKATKGDNLEINVVNNLNDNTMLQSTSIHWHGFFQAGTNWADGPAFVSQCPIAKGTSFLYNFPTAGQAGTFWYHSHLSTQYCDGLRGPLVVYDPNDPHAGLYDVDDESTVITLADWYHAKAKTLVIGTPDSTLINGLGRWSGGDATELAVITVQQGKRYRMRLINISCDPNFTFAIDNHTMTVIEADSVSHQPLEVDSIQIFAGQRYSFVLNANQTVGNYWVRANPNAGKATGFAGGINSAILRYVGAPEAEPDSVQTNPTQALKETDLVPLENPGAPGVHERGAADVNINLAIAFAGGSFKVNGAKFVPPSVPVLLQVLSGAQPADALLPSGSVISLPPNKVIELSIPAGAAGGPHPIHLHGHNFDVIRSAGSVTDDWDTPARRDVVSIGALNDNVTIRFVTDNPGPWILHCHIDWHLELGLAVVFAEDTNNWNSTINPSDDWDNLCPTYNNLGSGDL